jgi:hypothetical protein
MQTDELKIRVRYGYGGEVRGQVPREAVRGMTARELIAATARNVNGDRDQQRVAAIVTDLLKSGRPFDVVVSHPGRPELDDLAIAPDAVVLAPASEGTNAAVDALEVGLSEFYRGGVT